MLEMICVDHDERKEILDILLSIAQSSTVEYNIRADAADVIIRMTVKEDGEEILLSARNVLASLEDGDPNTSEGGDKSKTLLDNTIYSNAQNVHNVKIAECVNTFIEKIVRESKDNQQSSSVDSYKDVHDAVSELVRLDKSLTQEKRLCAYRALNRISVDTAKFSSYRVTIAEIFCHVWTRICKYKTDGKKTTAKMLEQRLVQELCDMSDTCSSGHSFRLVSVLATVDVDLMIGWFDQIKGNISGRLQARVRELKSELGQTIMLGMMRDADEADRKVYVSFLDKVKSELNKELKAEFVGDGYITDKEFEMHFDKAYTENYPKK